MFNSSLNYRVEGKGEPLLLVHGFGVSFNIWRNLLPLLCSRFTVVMIELPGIGESPIEMNDQSYLTASMEAIECLRSTLGFESWNILGYSTGSRIVEAYARAYASRVRGLLPRSKSLHRRTPAS